MTTLAEVLPINARFVFQFVLPAMYAGFGLLSGFPVITKWPPLQTAFSF